MFVREFCSGTFFFSFFFCFFFFFFPFYLLGFERVHILYIMIMRRVTKEGIPIHMYLNSGTMKSPDSLNLMINSCLRLLYLIKRMSPSLLALLFTSL
jgi:hypothetical protein